MANGTAFDRIQALLQAIQTPQGLQQAAQQLAAANVPAPQPEQVRQLFGGGGQIPQAQASLNRANPQPAQPALDNAAPQAAFNQGAAGLPQMQFPQLPQQAQAPIQIPQPQLQRAPVQAQGRNPFFGGF